MSTLSKNKSYYSQDILFLLFFGICFCIVGIGRGSLASWDEAYYALPSKGIFNSGDWVHLTFFNGPFYDKPPLYFWVTAFFYKLLGVGELATRLCSGLSGVGCVLMTYALGRRLFGSLVGLAGAGVLLSSTDFLHYARWGTLDVTHLLFFTAAIYFFLKGKEHSGYFVLFWLASALAIMTKGPLIVLAWGIVLIYSRLNREIFFLKSRSFWLGFILMLAVILPWHIAVYLRDRESFVRDFLYKHYIMRTTQSLEGHFGGYYFYIRTLINKYHPWVIIAIFSLPYTFWKAFKSHKNREAYGLLVIWVAVVFCFFTFLVQTKLKWYILPLYPALSLTVGLLLVKWFGHYSRVWFYLLIGTALFLHIPFSRALIHDFVPGIKTLAPQVKKLVKIEDTLYLYQYHEQPAALFYFERKVGYIDSPSELDASLSKKNKLYIVIPGGRYAELEEMFSQRDFQVIEKAGVSREAVVLLSNKRLS